jgi:hypothetical protein
MSCWNELSNLQARILYQLLNLQDKHGQALYWMDIAKRDRLRLVTLLEEARQTHATLEERHTSSGGETTGSGTDYA